jgi:TfoX/Sxy family transcriptional regulator of competence genes
VAYDERLVDRIRELVEAEPLLTEQRMFGGLALLIGGNMAVATSGQGGALIRVDPAKSARLIATTAAEPMLIGGRSMGPGWVHLDAEHVRTKRQLEKWIEIGVSFARSLPPNQPTRR